jgi:molybdenum cofactor cytidylyltransferase
VVFDLWSLVFGLWSLNAVKTTAMVVDERTSKTENQRSKTNSVAAVLLAAGRSRRMGKFKPLLPFGDQSVIQACINNIRGAGISEIVVVLGHRAKEIQEQLKHFNLTFACNPEPDSPMSASITVGVSSLSPSVKSALIALVDHPAVPPSVLIQLIAKWELGRGRFIQPEYEGHGGHPVLIDLEYRAELMNLDPQRGLRSLLEAHRLQVLRVSTDSPYVARDMDTWEDYLRLHQDVFGRPPDEI